MSKRDGQQGAGIESGSTHKEKIAPDYRRSETYNAKTKPAPAEKAPGGHVWRTPARRRLMA